MSGACNVMSPQNMLVFDMSELCPPDTVVSCHLSLSKTNLNLTDRILDLEYISVTFYKVVNIEKHLQICFISGK